MTKTERLVENCRDELVPAPFIQTEKELLDISMFTDENRQLLYRILDYLAGKSPYTRFVGI